MIFLFVFYYEKEKHKPNYDLPGCSEFFKDPVLKYRPDKINGS